MKKTIVLAVSSLVVTALVSFAQDDAKGKNGQGGDGKRPMPPLISALDQNADMTIDGKEIAGAPAALKKLDKNGDGKLSSEEYGFHRPATNANQPKRWSPPLVSTLDTNDDGTIDEKEIAASSQSLKKLDKNEDGKITVDEIRPQRPTTAEGEKKPEPVKKAEEEKKAEGDDIDLKPPTGGK